MASREVRDCGRKMWTCRKAEFIVDFSEASASAPEFGVVAVCCSFVPCWSWFRDFIAIRSCCTNREMEKVLSVSMMATQESLPPRDAGRIAVAVKR